MYVTGLLGLKEAQELRFFSGFHTEDLGLFWNILDMQIIMGWIPKDDVMISKLPHLKGVYVLLRQIARLLHSKKCLPAMPTSSEL